MYAFYSVDTGSHLTTENRQQRNTNLQLDAKDQSDSQSDTLCKWDKAPTGLGLAVCCSVSALRWVCGLTSCRSVLCGIKDTHVIQASSSGSARSFLSAAGFRIRPNDRAKLMFQFSADWWGFTAHTHTHTHWEGLFLDSDMTALTAVIIMGTWGGGGGRTHSVCFLCQAETFDFSPVNLYNPRTCQLWTLNSRERQKKKKTPSSLVYWAQAIMMSSCQSFTPFGFQGRRLELHIQLSSLRTLITFYQSTALICPHTLI